MRNTRLRTAKMISEIFEYEELNMLSLGDRSGGLILDYQKPIDGFLQKLNAIEQPVLSVKVSTKKLRAYENTTFLDKCYMNTDSIKIGNSVYSALRLSILLKFLGTETISVYQLDTPDKPIRIETDKGTAYLAPIVLDVPNTELETLETLTSFTN